MQLDRSTAVALVAGLAGVCLVGVVGLERPADPDGPAAGYPHGHRPRAASESPRDEWAVGLFRFYMPPGFHSVSGRRFDTLASSLQSSPQQALALGLGAHTERPAILQVFESEEGSFRLMFSVHPAPTPGSGPSRHRELFKAGQFSSRSRVGVELDIAGLEATVSTLYARSGGGLRVYDFALPEDPGQLHTIVIEFRDHEDDRGGRLASLLQSLRVQAP